MRDTIAWAGINFFIKYVASPAYRGRITVIIGNGIREAYGEAAFDHWNRTYNNG